MGKIIDGYFKHLSENPERIDNLFMWTVSTAFIWFWMVRYRERGIKGMEGSNTFWEGHEQVIYWCIFAVPPIIFKAAFISDNPLAVWYFLGGIIGFALFGTKLPNYILAFFGKQQVNDSPIKEVKDIGLEVKDNQK